MVITSDSRYTLKEPTIETGDAASLTITGVTRNDEGSYRCNATNQLNTVTSHAANLTVHCKFIIIQKYYLVYAALYIKAGLNLAFYQW